MLIGVRNEVMSETRDKQVPWEHSALRSKFYFAALPDAVTDKHTGPSYEQMLEEAFWHSVEDSTSPSVLSSYLERYPNGAFAAQARALIELHVQKAKVEAARRPEDRNRDAQAKAAAEVKRVEDERVAREAVLAEDRLRSKRKRPIQKSGVWRKSSALNTMR